MSLRERTFTPVLSNVLRQMSEAVAKEVGTVNLMTAYKRDLGGNLPLYYVAEVRILGSFGRNEANPYSDMDLWLITKADLPLTEIVKLSNAELKVRERLGRDYNYPNLDKHRATILSRDEANLYENTFVSRVAVLRVEKEATILWGDSPAPRTGVCLPDLVASMEEFDKLYSLAENGANGVEPKKYARRVCREMTYYRDGVRLGNNRQVDAEIALRYDNSPAKVMEESRVYRERLYLAGLDPEAVARRQIAHNCMFTLEKVRWELTYGLVDPESLETWRKGVSRKHAFYPDKIAEFVSRTAHQLKLDSTPELEQLKNISTEPLTIDLVEQFHKVHTQWMIEGTRRALDVS